MNAPTPAPKDLLYDPDLDDDHDPDGVHLSDEARLLLDDVTVARLYRLARLAKEDTEPIERTFAALRAAFVRRWLAPIDERPAPYWWKSPPKEPDR